MSTIKVDTVRPVTTDGSLTLQGDSSGSGVTGITIDSSGNATLNGTANNLGTVTAGTIETGVTINAGSSVSGIGQLIGVGYNYNNNTANSSTVTLESGKNYRVLMHIQTSGTPHYGYADVSVAGDGTVTITDRTTSINFSNMVLYSPASNQIYLASAGSANDNQLIFVFEV